MTVEESLEFFKNFPGIKKKLETLNEKFMEVVKAKGYKTGDFFMSLRVAITGSKFTPPINDSIIILGKEETINRIKSVA